MMQFILNDSGLNAQGDQSSIHNWLVTDRGEADAYKLTKAELESFINSSPADSDAQDFQGQYNTIKYMINPAYYNEESGFLGTYDETNDIFYSYSNYSMAVGSKPAAFTTIHAFDLSEINPYVPADVVSATVTVE